MDHGSYRRIGLPELTMVEKRFLALATTHSVIIKVQANVTANKGHCISIPQSWDDLSKVVPDGGARGARRDPAQCGRGE